MYKREHLELLVRLNHPEVLEALMWFRENWNLDFAFAKAALQQRTKFGKVLVKFNPMIHKDRDVWNSIGDSDVCLFELIARHSDVPTLREHFLAMNKN